MPTRYGRHILFIVATLAVNFVPCFCEDVIPYHTDTISMSTMAECLSCHDGMTATLVTACLGAQCLYTNDHSVMDPYPPINKQNKFASQAELELAGGILENGKTTCLSCHKMANPAPHLIKPREKDQICLVCHISQIPS